MALACQLIQSDTICKEWDLTFWERDVGNSDEATYAIINRCNSHFWKMIILLDSISHVCSQWKLENNKRDDINMISNSTWSYNWFFSIRIANPSQIKLKNILLDTWSWYLNYSMAKIVQNKCAEETSCYVFILCAGASLFFSKTNVLQLLNATFRRVDNWYSNYKCRFLCCLLQRNLLKRCRGPWQNADDYRTPLQDIYREMATWP